MEPMGAVTVAAASGTVPKSVATNRLRKYLFAYRSLASFFLQAPCPSTWYSAIVKR